MRTTLPFFLAIVVLAESPAIAADPWPFKPVDMTREDLHAGKGVFDRGQ